MRKAPEGYKEHYELPIYYEGHWDLKLSMWSQKDADGNIAAMTLWGVYENDKRFQIDITELNKKNIKAMRKALKKMLKRLEELEK